MNLYEIRFIHYSEKDDEAGVIAYLVASSDEEVYDWLKSEPEVPHLTESFDRQLFNSYDDEDKNIEKTPLYDDSFTVIGFETAKERILRYKGTMYDPDAPLEDLHEGCTQYGWGLLKEGITADQIQTLKDVGITVFEHLLG
jgi:hypothetical protein